MICRQVFSMAPTSSPRSAARTQVERVLLDLPADDGLLLITSAQGTNDTVTASTASDIVFVDQSLRKSSTAALSITPPLEKGSLK